ncbi:MAG: undecaprenyldiphospho-muramoylpentapeptide beta-N-acetylglucosaminyltransferase [Chloroflexi bacterium]|nr:undecaprenyldiphospho-muramoylpentapeptide beta-N-acetylglucosaminyltransferase [Chloroflexota bacterium]
MKKYRVILTGGGTGGHLYPGLAVAGALKERGDVEDILFLGVRHGIEASVVPSEGYRVEFVPAKGLGGGVFKKVEAVMLTCMGIISAYGKIRKWKPDLIIGLGGYASVPGVIAGHMNKVPILLLEQNRVPGKASRFLAGKADIICVSFPDSGEHLPQKNVEFTGNPVREKIISADREESRKKLGINNLCILVTGASQGARSINYAVLDALRKWKDNDWTLVHLTGKKEYPAVAREKESVLPGPCRLDYRPLAYVEDIHEYYAAADLVIARSGATTLAEITARGLPAVLVPFPYAAGGHQEQNARWLESAGGAVVLPDNELEGLSGIVEELSSDPKRLDDMRTRSRGAGKPDALRLIMTQVDKLLNTGERSSQ